jgi:small subunit ribosomal protein S6
LRDYELMIVLDPSLDDAAVEAATQRITGLIEQRGGTVENVDPWGRRRLAYPVGKNRDATYILFRMNIEPKGAFDLEHALSLIEPIMRHLVIRVETRAVAATAAPAAPVAARAS